MTRAEEVAWAAGLFEGEGTVGYQEQNGRIRVRFALSMTDEDIVQRFQKVMGCGNITGPAWPTGATKPQWRWSVTSRADAATVSDLLYPHLGERRFATQPDPRRHNSEKTHCPNGHAYEGDNLSVYPYGGRRCRECQRVQGFRKNRGLPAGAPVPARSYWKRRSAA